VNKDGSEDISEVSTAEDTIVAEANVDTTSTEANPCKGCTEVVSI